MATSPIGRYQIEDAAGTGIDTSRGRSAILWGNSLDKYGDDRTLGTLFTEDFTEPRTGTVATVNKDWFLAEAGDAGATAEGFDSNVSANADSVGEAILTAAVTTATHDGVQVLYGDLATASIGTMTLYKHATRGRGRSTFEIRIDPALAPAFFIGHSELSGAVLTATSTMSATLDFIGFHRLTTTGDVFFVSAINGTGGTNHSVTVATAAQVEAGYNKFGWAVESGGEVILTRNGQYLETESKNVPIAALPDQLLGRRIAITKGGEAGTALSCLVDWFDDHTSDAR